jgi:hypothetical protein
MKLFKNTIFTLLALTISTNTFAFVVGGFGKSPSYLEMLERVKIAEKQYPELIIDYSNINKQMKEMGGKEFDFYLSDDFETITSIKYDNLVDYYNDKEILVENEKKYLYILGDNFLLETIRISKANKKWIIKGGSNRVDNIYFNIIDIKNKKIIVEGISKVKNYYNFMNIKGNDLNIVKDTIILKNDSNLNIIKDNTKLRLGYEKDIMKTKEYEKIKQHKHSEISNFQYKMMYIDKNFEINENFEINDTYRKRTIKAEEIFFTKIKNEDNNLTIKNKKYYIKGLEKKDYNTSIDLITDQGDDLFINKDSFSYIVKNNKIVFKNFKLENKNIETRWTSKGCLMFLRIMDLKENISRIEKIDLCK